MAFSFPTKLVYFSAFVLYNSDEGFKRAIEKSSDTTRIAPSTESNSTFSWNETLKKLFTHCKDFRH